jgi:hypothetical protein
MKDALIEYFAAVPLEARSFPTFVKEFFLHLTTILYVIIRRKLRVLVPGAGLGRLAYEVAKLGMHILVHNLFLRDSEM